MATRVYVDGSTRRVCYLIEGERPRVVDLPKAVTSNEGEYHAIIKALRAKQLHLVGEIEIISDSQLAVFQLNTLQDPSYMPHYKLKEPRLLKLAEVVMRLCKGKSVVFSWVPREENKAGWILG